MYSKSRCCHASSNQWFAMLRAEHQVVVQAGERRHRKLLWRTSRALVSIACRRGLAPAANDSRPSGLGTYARRSLKTQVRVYPATLPPFQGSIGLIDCGPRGFTPAANDCRPCGAGNCIRRVPAHGGRSPAGLPNRRAIGYPDACTPADEFPPIASDTEATHACSRSRVCGCPAAT